MNILKKENKWITLGFFFAILGLISPVVVMYITGWQISFNRFEKLAAVGDFFGGTTVGLLSLAGILFVTAAIVMQKEELKLQREELEKTREEYKLTNQTLKKQQFETTFFNMINLHYDLIDNIDFSNINKGRQALMDYYRNLTSLSSDIKKQKVINIFKDISFSDKEIEEFLLCLNINIARSNFITDYKELNYPRYKDGQIISSNEDDDFLDFVSSVLNNTNSEWVKEKEKINSNFITFKNPISEKKLANSYVEYILDNIDEFQTTNVGIKINTLYNVNPTKSFKSEVCVLFFEKYDHEFGQAFRNISNIFTLINEEITNEKDIQKYVNILKGQLSSIEILFVFYYLIYYKSNNELLEGKNYIELEIIKNKLIWKNDKNIIEKL